MIHKVKKHTIGLGLLSLCMIVSLGQAEAQQGTKAISLEDVVRGKFWAYGAGYGIRSLPDGEHYTMMTKGHNAIVRYSFATGQVVDTLFATNNARECSFDRFDDYDISPDGRHILLYTEQESIYRRSSKAVAHHFDVRRRLVKPLSDQQGKVMIPTFSPDGRMVAFVRDNNIYIKKFDFDTEVAVTTDGKRNEVINGATDWVYEEEFSTTNQLSWSEDGAFLAFVKTDERTVPEFRMQIYANQLYPSDYVYKYPKAGQPNSRVSVHIYNVGDRSQKRVAIPESDSYYIPRISYIGREHTLAVMTLNRRQNHFRMIYVNSKTLIPKTIMEEQSQTYVDSEHIQSLRFTSEGYAYLSERSGWTHIYLMSDGGQLVRPITRGQWDVTEFYGVDNKGNAYYQAADQSPTRRNIYRVDSKGNNVRLGAGEGTNRATFAEGFRYYVGSYSALNEPMSTAIYRTDGNKVLRTLEDNSRLRNELKAYRFAHKELTTIRTASGLELNAWLVKPHDFDPSKRYPVLMVQYSGPNSQLVLDEFRFGWEYYLASQGIVVACVDGRGTGARGEAWRKGTYLRLGVQESADQVAAAKALGKLPWVDEARIGIWGWSFGGYNTLMSLIHGSGTFRLGIAVAPVTDWRYYDTIYTERFMRTPAENPAGYAESSVLEHAHKLQGRLLLIHGSADDNVHVQNSMDLSNRLIEAGIAYDMAIYPDQDHSIRAGGANLHIYRRMAQYLHDHL